MSLSAHLIVQTNIVFGICIVVGITGLTFKKIIRNTGTRYHEWRKRSYRAASIQYLLVDDSPALGALTPRWPGDRRALLEIFVHSAENIKGALSERLYQAFEELGLVHYSLRRLRSWRWWVRAEAAYHLGWMHSPRSEQALFHALKDARWEVMLSASRSLARQKGVGVLPAILQNFKHLSRWASLEAAEIFFEMGRDVIPKLLEVLRGLPAEAQRLVIEVLAHYRDAHATETLIELLGSSDHEVRARAIKALGAIRDNRAAPKLTGLLEDGSWQIRLLACTALGQLGARRALPQLARRLEDPDARVRLRAAGALAALGEPGLLRLKEAHAHGGEALRRLLRPYVKTALLLAAFCGISWSDASRVEPIQTALAQYRQDTVAGRPLAQRLTVLEPVLAIVMADDAAQNARRYYARITQKGASEAERLIFLTRFLEKHAEPVLRARTADLSAADAPLYAQWVSESILYARFLAERRQGAEARLDNLDRVFKKSMSWKVPRPLTWRTALSWRPWHGIPHWMNRVLHFYDRGVLYYFAALNLIYLLLFFISLLAIVRYLQLVKVPFTRSLLHSPMTLPISILVPAFNEEAAIVESVRSFLTVHFREFEVIVINDGSSDRTMQVLHDTFQLRPATLPNAHQLPSQKIRATYRSPRHANLLVIDKENGGKSDALNAGINLSRYPLFCAVDADSVLEPQALLRVVRPFMIDPSVVAVGGVVRIANGNKVRNGAMEDVHLPRQALPLFQIVEYLRAFFAGRMGWSAMQSLLLISGAFGIFRKDAVLACGGYRTDTVGEDMDLVIRLHKYLRDEEKPYQMVFIPDPICWTEVPDSRRVLRAQRDRWQRGLLETLWTNRRMIMNPRYGRIGLIALPYYVIFELFGPLIEFGGYVAVALTVILMPHERTFLLLFFMTAIFFGILLSIGAVVLEELAFHRYPKVRQMMVLILFSFLENFGYRQINAWWRCRGLIRGLMKKQGWGTMVRRGLGHPAARHAPPAPVNTIADQALSVPTRSSALTPGLKNLRQNVKHES